MEQAIAWSILTVFYIAVVMPFIGTLFSGQASTYGDDFGIGLLIHVVIAVISGVIWVLAWSVNVIFS